MYRFLIVIKSNGNSPAYCPDLPGCVATGKTCEETARNMHEFVQMHIQGMIENKIPTPDNVAYAKYIASSRVVYL